MMRICSAITATRPSFLEAQQPKPRITIQRSVVTRADRDPLVERLRRAFILSLAVNISIAVALVGYSVMS